MSELIKLNQSNSNPDKWSPIFGAETHKILNFKGFVDGNGKPNEEGHRILSETQGILSSCGNPSSNNHRETGIVVGYVQSGKTLSFTTLTALASDNDYQVVIIIAGMTTNLVEQSTKRLTKDLQIESRSGLDQKWALFKNPESKEDISQLKSILDQWKDPQLPSSRCKTAVITVMKGSNRLDNLVRVLKKLDLRNVPTLIIDDEGDQASLNTKARAAARNQRAIEELTESDISTIYKRINNLRDRFEHHTFLQYTATPQANLFINILDRLSPNFLKLLTPGSDYVGGKAYFLENPHLIKRIPESEIPSNDNFLAEPPSSLIKALSIFYLGVAAGIMNNDQGNRSMIVHPSRLQEDHTTYFGWVKNIQLSWVRLLEEGDDDEKHELLSLFERSYEGLLKSVGKSLPSLEAIIQGELLNAIKYTQIIEVNSRTGPTPSINWQNWYSWILVGGQSMDRGFTVEGLTVTYMPRNLGVGNVDTVQQRARFFGYKKSYLQYCRVYLDQQTIDAYQHIVRHEQDIRERLEQFNVNGSQLDNFNREVVLDTMLSLTRSNVLYDPLERDQLSGWFAIKAPQDSEDLISENRKVVYQFYEANRTKFVIDAGHPERTEQQKHLTAHFTIKTCLTELLNKLKFTRESDSSSYSSLRARLKNWVEHGNDEECAVYFMSSSHNDGIRVRKRSLKSNGEIKQVFQGKQPTRNTDRYQIGEVYPGDRKINDPDKLSIQIHLFELGEGVLSSVPSISIWIPEHLGSNLIRQWRDNR